MCTDGNYSSPGDFQIQHARINREQLPRVYLGFSPRKDCVIAEQDCRDLLKLIPSESVSLTITSPPYCMGKDYDSSCSIEDFQLLHREILPEVVRITKQGGSICWQTGYHVKNGITTPLDLLIHMEMARYNSVQLRNRIVWAFDQGLHCKNRFSGRHETILWYTKGPKYTFNLDSVRVSQKYPGKMHYKGLRKGTPSCNPSGKNPGNVWTIPAVSAGHPEKTSHPCQFPIALAERLVLALSNKGDIIFDPFTGTGSVAIAAMLHDRRFWGSEISAEYRALAATRCRSALRGNLKFRQMDKPVMIPDPRTKVARSPYKALPESNGRSDANC